MTAANPDNGKPRRVRPACIALAAYVALLLVLPGAATGQTSEAAPAPAATTTAAARSGTDADAQAPDDTPGRDPAPATAGGSSPQKNADNPGTDVKDLDARIARWKQIDWEALVQKDQVEFLAKLRQKCIETLVDFTATFHKQERIRGKLRGKEVAQMKFRAEPFSVYMKYTKGDKGREALYVDGRYDNKLQVHPGGLLGPLFQLKIEPDSDLATRDNLRLITMAGMTSMLNTVLPQFELARANGDLTVSYLGKMDVGGRKAYAIKRILPKKDIYPCKELVFFIDCQALVPIGADSYAWDNQLQSTYRYTDFKLNTGLTDDDFDRRNKAYNF